MRIAWLSVLVACSSPGWRSGSSSNRQPSEETVLSEHRLTSAESDIFDDHGFVIVEQPVHSFHLGYNALYHAHQPVLITADSLLYAWHSSYDHILIQIEREDLIPTLDRMLGELRGSLATINADPQARADLDVYLAIAQSLRVGKPVDPVAGGDAALIGSVFASAEKANGLGFELFGQPQQFDFSMLQPRGHYTQTLEMQRYFRAMSWLGRAQILIARKNAGGAWKVDRRALHAALLLGRLFDDSTRARWQAIDTMLETLVGPPDSMSLPGLSQAVAALGGDVDAKTDDEIAAAFGTPAAEKIRTQLAHIGEQSIGFLLLGQRFVRDSQVFSDLTAGSLDGPRPRLMPTPLDVGYAVFHNPAARKALASELAAYGVPYERALEAEAKQRFDHPSLYHLWLDALRELSPDATRDANLPAPLRGDAWARRMLQGQLASWTELRHDNLLYAKQSVTAELGCEYPEAYVDPYPAFYANMEALARKGRIVVEKFPFRSPNDKRVVEYFDGMAKTMARLRVMAERERRNEPLTEDDMDFINHMTSLHERNAVCTTVTEAKGWYAELFYDQAEALWHKPIVADVHTQPTDEAGNMVGRVLHVGTGYPRMMVIKIDHDGGKHTQTYRGFVSTYGEQITENFKRLTDDEWRVQVDKQQPAPPTWLGDVIAR